MKQLLLIALVLFSIKCHSQDISQVPWDSLANKVVYNGVVPAEGANQAELYGRAKVWVASTYRSGKDATLVEDVATGVILIKGWIPWSSGFYSGEVVKLWHTVRIAVKDGRFRYEITDLEVQMYATNVVPNPRKIPVGPYPLYKKNGEYDKAMDKHRIKLNERVQPLVTSLLNGMSKEVSGTSKNDW